MLCRWGILLQGNGHVILRYSSEDVSGVRLKSLSLASTSTLPVSRSSLTTTSCPFPAAHDSGVRPYFSTLERQGVMNTGSLEFRIPMGRLHRAAGPAETRSPQSVAVPISSQFSTLSSLIPGAPGGGSVHAESLHQSRSTTVSPAPSATAST